MLNPDFRDMLSELSDSQAKYIIVGAYALAAHGYPRATGDIDIWVDATPENAENVLAALAKFGAPLDQITVADLSAPGLVFQIGIAPRRIDILTSITAVEFSEAWKRKQEIDVDGISVPILAEEDFLANKKALGRPKDLADIDAILNRDSDKQGR